MSATSNDSHNLKRMSEEKKVVSAFLMIGVLSLIAGAGLHNDDLLGVGGIVSVISFFFFAFSD